MQGLGVDKFTGETLIQCLKRQISALTTDMNSYVKHWNDLSSFIMPRSTRFFLTARNSQGNARNTKIINATATMAVRTASSGLMTGITSPSRPWFNLVTGDKELNKKKEVKLWLSAVRDAMSEVFIKSNLYTTLPSVYEDLLVFGTSAFVLMEDDEDGIRCYHMPIGSYVLRTSYRGNVNGVYREFKMSVEQMVKQFGLANCTTKVQELWRQKNYNHQIDITHCVEENPDADEKRLESRYLPFRSIYFETSTTEDKPLSFKGLNEMAVMAPRWRVIGEDSCGVSPCMDALGDVMQLQKMEQRKLQLLDMLLQPPRNVPVNMRNEYIGTLAGENTFIPSSAAGSKVEPSYVPNPYLNHLEVSIQGVEQRIKHALFEDIFLMIAEIDRGGVTATEIQARQQEKMMVMGPVLERLNDELLDPIVRRTYAIMERAGKIPVPPPELQDKDISVEYISIMAQAMKLNGVVAVERLVGFIGSLAGARPDALDKLNVDNAIDVFSDMVGTPPQLINDLNEVAEIRDVRAQQAQAANALAMAQQGADAAKTLSETQISTPSMLQAMSGALQGGQA